MECGGINHLLFSVDRMRCECNHAAVGENTAVKDLVRIPAIPATQSGNSQPLSTLPCDYLFTYHSRSWLARNFAIFASISPASGSCARCESDQSDQLLQNPHPPMVRTVNSPPGASPRCRPAGGIFMCFSSPCAFPFPLESSTSRSLVAFAGSRPPARATVRHPFPTCHSWNF